ncbi:MAG: hypothetical protein LCI02_04930 [Proteobacteria bacterium]|nr:hypothetical protein [Pseudomonadota bacterium]
MSYAITALALLRLRAEPGQWVPVAELARFMAVAEEPVRMQLGFLEAAGDVQVQRGAGDQIQAALVSPRADDFAPVLVPLDHPSDLERFERPSCALAGHSLPEREPR